VARAAARVPAARQQRAAPVAGPVNAEAIAAFAQSLAARPALTRSAYVRDATVLAMLAGDAALASLGPHELRRMLATLHGRGLSGRSLARVLSSWRALYRFLIERTPAIGENPCAGLKAPKAARRLPDALSPDEAVRLVAITGDDPFAVRDRALLELLYSSGLRVSELAGADVDRIDFDRGEIRVWGKGQKERIVPVGAPAQAALRAWLDLRTAVPGADPKAVFVGASGRRMSVRTIERRLAAWAQRQGLARHVHPHMLRHSFASHLLQSSGDLRAVQELLGHASIASTQVYTHLDFQYLAKAYDQAHPRAKRRRP
jgi:integrase/recombinase XerC